MEYVNKTFNELWNMGVNQKVREQFKEWDDRGKDKLAPYTVKLAGKQVKAYGDLRFIDGQKSIEYQTTYGDILSLKGKRKPKTTNLFFILEYDFINDNEAQMRQFVNDLDTMKENREPVAYSVIELGIEFQVTIETLDVSYKGARDIYIMAELMQVKASENSN